MSLRLVPLVVLVSCVHLPSQPHAPTGRPAQLEIDLFVPKQGPVQVRLTVPKANLPQQPQKLSLRFLRLSDEAWKLVRGLPRSGLVSSSDDLQVEYEVDVRRLGDSGNENRLAVAADLPSGRFLPLWALVPLFEGAVQSERLKPISMHIASELPFTTSMAGEGATRWVEDLNELYSGVLLAGTRYEAKASGGLRVISTDFDRPTIERYAELERRANTLLEGWTGPRQPLRTLVVIRLPPGVSPDGVRGVNYGLNAAVLAGSPFDGAATSSEGLTTLHELTHSHLPPDGKVPHWIGEGLADSFAQRAALELDGFGPEVRTELLENTWKAFLEESPNGRAGSSAIGDYYGGSVLAYCIDVRLRRDGSSLEAVLRQARARAQGELTNDLWEAEMAVTSPSAGARIVSATRDPLDPPSACFAEAGLRRRPPVDGLPNHQVHWVTGIRSFTLDPGSVGVVVGSVVADSPFLPGDRLTWLDGVRLVSPDHLREALLAASRKGSTVRFEYLRAGVSRFVDRPLPAEVSSEPTGRAVWFR